MLTSLHGHQPDLQQRVDRLLLRRMQYNGEAASDA